mmetsp:Transcript_96366/g.272574  ORF Transcript_96366/g.272574 Transcript_96366/m.272574 type:complete len:265 (+) Transcript_96366:473-1267(+)
MLPCLAGALLRNPSEYDTAFSIYSTDKILAGEDAFNARSQYDVIPRAYEFDTVSDGPRHVDVQKDVGSGPTPRNHIAITWKTCCHVNVLTFKPLQPLLTNRRQKAREGAMYRDARGSLKCDRSREFMLVNLFSYLFAVPLTSAHPRRATVHSELEALFLVVTWGYTSQDILFCKLFIPVICNEVTDSDASVPAQLEAFFYACVPERCAQLLCQKTKARLPLDCWPTLSVCLLHSPAVHPSILLQFVLRQDSANLGFHHDGGRRQ